ncbi:MAG: hypothetical protein IPG79_07065 [Saprospiraceae bacterium]|nr:hypothetical protein [Saprospiraceae bacterium]MBK9043775.1 hypothetical protein [Saprospiraceae bacterium]
MYRTFLFFSFVFLLSSCEPKVLPTVIEFKQDQVMVKFSHMSTMAEFAQAAIQCNERNINMQYAGSEFFEDGRVKKLAIQLTMPNGKSGNTTADLTTLQYKYYGFMVADNGYFKIGHID